MGTGFAKKIVFPSGLAGDPRMSNTDENTGPFRQAAWPRLRMKLFHLYFLFARPMTLGVRGVIHDEAKNAVFLIRHTYVPGWQFPGGGVERGETMLEALTREVREECDLEIEAQPALTSIHFNRHISPRDHVAVYLVRAFRQISVKQPDSEIAEARFFPLDALPETITPATARRIAEIFGGQPPSPYW